MDFGRLEKVDGVKFSLPVDHASTASVLAGKRKQKCKIYVGCPAWSEPKLVGRLYPKGTKPQDFLRLYSRQFNAIELNVSGYGMPSDEEIDQWISEVPKGFIFCPKLPPQVAKTRPLAKNREAYQQSLKSLERFGDHLGPLMLQLHPTFKTERLDDLLAFLELWNNAYPLCVELRNPSWFDGSAQFDELLSAMRKRKAALVITDVTGRRDVCHMALTIPSAFIRFDGHDLHKTDFERLDQWADRIAHWIDMGLRSLYFFVHTPKYELNPELAHYFIAALNKRAGLTHPEPELLVRGGR